MKNKEELNAVDREGNAAAPKRTELNADELAQAAGGGYGERVYCLYFKRHVDVRDNNDTIAEYLMEKTGYDKKTVLLYITGKAKNGMEVDISFETAKEIWGYLYKYSGIIVEFE